MGASFWNPILLALVLAITIAPALGWLQGKGLPGPVDCGPARDSLARVGNSIYLSLDKQ